MRTKNRGIIAILSALALVGRPAPAELAAQAFAIPSPGVATGMVPGGGPVDPAAARYAGLSGALKAVVLEPASPLEEGLLRAVRLSEGVAARWLPLAGTEPLELLGSPLAATGMRAPESPGIWALAAADPGEAGEPPFALITRIPFSRKRGTVLNGYHIGRYPTEGSGRTDRYAPPAGFIEVTRENQDFHVSRHFQLRHFLTKDQLDVWPKYLVLDLRLVDKLELVLQELNAMGIRADRMHVMSGYRTPQYNGPGEGGRAQLSRHTYGDAADVWVDSDGNGYMDDLNGDGVADIRDAEVLLRAVERVESRHPELLGGAGLYVPTSAHGPFVHIDVRGAHARW